MKTKQPFLKRILLLAGQGILTLFPLAVTIYLVYWIVSTFELTVRKYIELFMPDIAYFPGLGIAVGIVLLLVVGWVVNMFFIRKLLEFGSKTFEKIPLVKTIYTGLRDLVGFMSVAKKQHQGSVVLVDMGDKSLIGFVTDRNAGKTLGIDDDNLVGVYMPLGYMIGGYTVYQDKNKLRHLNIGAEEAMRLVLTGGMASGSGSL